MKGMIASLVDQLKNELGDEFGDAELEEKELIQEIEVPDDLSKIDEMLKHPGLSEEEVNKLLDERSKLARNLPFDPDDILSNPNLSE